MRLIVDKNEYTIYDPTIFQADERGNNMYREEYGHYSWILDKDMRIIIYGNSRCYAFQHRIPCQITVKISA